MSRLHSNSCSISLVKYSLYKFDDILLFVVNKVIFCLFY
ncbi:hypothetical protein A1OE_783 [Candidatus Endolissoclinum faulkneri L2]|uniref:Uncharacterized protein n=1 Tax=Candidatus Endolissoclinum faulkneri L2 TaxID=1193729 RepID=K7Z4P4_9PROT|nr:hypothetical protein A1OE_783 [Candidatus Endolissoclinum faulkneri L2]